MIRKRNIAQERAHSELVLALTEMEIWYRNDQLKRAHVPDAWHAIEKEVPVGTRRTKLTVSFDADMTKWYRAMGPGYQARMNKVLRVYMLSVIAKEIEVRGDRNWKGDPI